jgi:hypothetical protein
MGIKRCSYLFPAWERIPGELNPSPILSQVNRALIKRYKVFHHTACFNQTNHGAASGCDIIHSPSAIHRPGYGLRYSFEEDPNGKLASPSFPGSESGAVFQKQGVFATSPVEFVPLLRPEDFWA